MTRGIRGRPWRAHALAASAAALAVLVYLNALDNPFVYDDHRLVLENYSIRDPSNLRALLLNDVFRPVVNVSYALDYAIWRLKPFGYHLTSVLLHAANIVLLFVLMRTLAGDAVPMTTPRGEATRAAPVPSKAGKKQKSAIARPARDPAVPATANAAAFAAAAVWAVHPLMTQAVGYVSGRSEVLCAFFFLPAFLLLRAWALGGDGRWLASGLACWLLALGSKETAVMLPVVLLACDWLLPSAFDATARMRLRRLYIPMLAFVAVAGAARLFVFAGVENAGRTAFSWGNALVSLDVVRRYVYLMLLTAPQSIFHSALPPSSVLRPIVVLNALWMAGLIVVAWRVYRRAPLVAFGALWFVLMLLPSIAMLVLDVGEPMAEQRAYLAGSGFAMAVGAAFERLRTWPPGQRVAVRALVTVLFGVLLLSLGIRTAARNAVWSDPMRLWTEAVANAPDIWIPHRGLGDALRDKGDFAGAAGAYRQAARLRPEQADTHLALGVALMVTGQLAEADSALAEATRLSPGLERAETARGMIARMTGRRDEARDRFLGVARAHPNAVIARQHLADMYEHDYADYAGALRMCREVQALAPQAQGVGECIARNRQRLEASAAPAEKR
jgi:tetratricopeptide (TPR) repeat protein